MNLSVSPLLSLPRDLAFKILNESIESFNPTRESFELEDGTDLGVLLITSASAFFEVYSQSLHAQKRPAFYREGIQYSIIYAANQGILPISAMISTYGKLLSVVTNAPLKLTKLHLDRFGIVLKYNFFKQRPEIKDINISLESPNDQEVINLLENKKLESLSLTANNMTTTAIKEILKHPLNELHLYLAYNLNDEHINTICNIKTLKKLTITYANQITKDALIKLFIRCLEMLDITGITKPFN